MNIRSVFIALAAMLLSSHALAQAYPTKPITMIVPFAAGGPTDTVARSVAAIMSKSLGQTVIVENAGGVVTNWQGEAVRAGGQVLAAANRVLHAQALAALHAC